MFNLEKWDCQGNPTAGVERHVGTSASPITSAHLLAPFFRETSKRLRGKKSIKSGSPLLSNILGKWGCEFWPQERIGVPPPTLLPWGMPDGSHR